MTESRACYFVACVGGDLDFEDPAMLRYYELAMQAEAESGIAIEALTGEDGGTTVVVGSMPGHSLGVERYLSLEEFWLYWNSDLYQSAKRVRSTELTLEMAFAVCLPGKPASELPEIGPETGWSISVVQDSSELDLDSPDVLAAASEDELQLVEGENPFSGCTWILKVHSSRSAAESAAPKGAVLYAVMSGAAPQE